MLHPACRLDPCSTISAGATATGEILEAAGKIIGAVRSLLQMAARGTFKEAEGIAEVGRVQRAMKQYSAAPGLAATPGGDVILPALAGQLTELRDAQKELGEACCAFLKRRKI